jgi:hypothetical protein
MRESGPARRDSAQPVLRKTRRVLKPSTSSTGRELAQFGNDRLGSGIGEGAGIEQDMAADIGLIGEKLHHLKIGERAIGVVLLAAELAGMEQGDDVEARQQLCVAGVDVTEIGAVALGDRRVVDRQLDEGIIFLGRGGDAEHGAVELRLGAADADIMVPARAEMVDALAGEALLLEPFDEMHVAGALLDPQAPIDVPDVQHAISSVMK